MSSPRRVVHEFAVADGFVRTELAERHGETQVDVRLWREPRDESDAALVETQARLRIPLAYLPELREALDAVDEAITRERGELAARRQRRRHRGQSR